MAFKPIVSEELEFISILQSKFESKFFYFPKVAKDKMNFYQVENQHGFIDSGKSFLEPDSDIVWEHNSQEKVLIIVPCLAADNRGVRLGRGKGFYDRFLAEHISKKNITTLSVVPEFAYSKNGLPKEEFDILIDMVMVVGLNSVKIVKE